MRAGWNGAPAPVFQTLRVTDRLRMIVRGVAATVLTALFFAAFLLFGAIDRIAATVRGAPSRGLASWAIAGWAGTALALLGLKVRVSGAPLSGSGALVANHSSWIDIVVLQRTSRAFFVSKAEVASWPVIGAIGKAIGTAFIERRPTEAKRQNEVLRARLLRGDRLCLFPEATSTDGRRVLAFNSSLFAVFTEPDLRGNLMVQPVSLRYRPKAGLPETLYAWWGEMEFGAHLGHVLAVSTGGTVDVVFHDPLRPEEFSDRKALASRARSIILDGFQTLERLSPERR